MSDTDKDVAAINALEKVQKYIQEHPEFPLSKEEVLALKDVAAREIGWAYVGKIGARWKTILKYIGFFIGAWLLVKANAIEWIQGVVK